MNILYINQYFIPEIEPSASKIFELSKKFIKQGHKVRVITGFPNYPSGKIYPGYKLRIYRKEKLDGVDITRVFLIPSASGRFIRRVLGHLSFMFSAVVAGLFSKRPDVVICSCPPLEIALSGWLVARLKGAKFVFEIRDLWPDDAIKLGIIKNTLLVKFLRWLEKFIYRRANLIIPVSGGFVNYLLSCGVAMGKIRVIINGTDINLFRPRKAKEQSFIKDGFICLYLGTQGLQNNLIPLMEAIKNMGGEYSGIKFIFLGDGCERQSLIRYCQKYKIESVEFLSPVSREVAAEYVNKSDICLIHTKKIDINKRHIPAKLYDYMAGGRPVVAGIAGQGRKIIEEASAGICTEPENSMAMQKTIFGLLKDKNLREKYGGNGRSYAEKNFSRKRIAQQYLEVITALKDRKR